MSKYITHRPFLAGDLISERAARRVAAHPRVAAAPGPSFARADPINPAPVRQPATPTPAPVSDPRILRRWSVAELIARAATGPAVAA